MAYASPDSFRMGNKKKKDDDDDDFMQTVIEIDETYLGGKAENKHMNERIAAKGIFEKSIVLGMLERDKEVRGFVIDEAKRDTIMAKIHENVKKGRPNNDRRTQGLLLALYSV